MSPSTDQQDQETKITATKKPKSIIKGVRKEKRKKTKSQSEQIKRKPYFKINLREPKSKPVKQNTKEKDTFPFTTSEEVPLAQLVVEEKPIAENKHHDENDAASPKSETTLDFIRRALATDTSESSREPKTAIEEQTILPENSQKKKLELDTTGELRLLENSQVIKNLKDIKLLSPVSDKEPIFSTGELIKTLELSQRAETVRDGKAQEITNKFELTEELNMISEEIAFMNRFSGTLKSPVVARNYMSEDDVDENSDKLMLKSVAIVGLPKEIIKEVKNVNKLQCGNRNIEERSDVSKETNSSDEKIGLDFRDETSRQRKIPKIVLERLNFDTLNLRNESLENPLNSESENHVNSAGSPSRTSENNSKKIKHVVVADIVDNENPFAASQSEHNADEDGKISKSQENGSQDSRKGTEKSDLSQKSGHSSDMYSSQRSKDSFEHSPKLRNLKSKIPRLKGKSRNRMSAVEGTATPVDKRTVEIQTGDEKTNHERKIVPEKSSGPSFSSRLSSHEEQNSSELSRKINNEETVHKSPSQNIEKKSDRIMDNKVQENHEVSKVTDHISQADVIEKETVQPLRSENIDDGMEEKETNHIISPVSPNEVVKAAKKLENEKILNKNNDDHNLLDKPDAFDPRLGTTKVCDLQGEKRLSDPRDLSQKETVLTDDYNVKRGSDEDEIKYGTSRLLSKSIGKKKDIVTKTESAGSRRKRPQVSNRKHENEKFERSASEERDVFEDSGSDSYKPPVKQQKRRGNKPKPAKNASKKIQKEFNRIGRGQKKICKKKTVSTLDDIESRGSFDDSSIDLENLHEFPFTFDDLIESLHNEDPAVKNAGLGKPKQSQRKKKYKPLAVETVKTSSRLDKAQLKSVEENIESADKEADIMEENDGPKKTRKSTNENAEPRKRLEYKEPKINIISNILLNKRKSSGYNSSAKRTRRIDSSVTDVSLDSRTVSDVSLDEASVVADDKSNVSDRFNVSQFERTELPDFDMPETEKPIMSWIATGQQDDEISYIPEALRWMKEHFAFLALTERGPVDGGNENYLKAFWKINDILEKYV